MGQAKESVEGLYEPLVKVAAILGVIQGLIWTVLSLTAILLAQISLNFNVASPGTIIYYLYLNSNDTSSYDNLIINPDSFSYFVYIYTILSGAWLIASSLLLWDQFKGKSASKYHEGVLVTWTVIVVLSSVLDLILFSLLLSDYQKFRNISSTELNDTEMQLILVAVGVLFTLVARGYVLWIINVIFAVITGKVWYLKRNKVVARNQPFINAYSNGQSVPWQQNPNFYEDSSSSVFDNKGYRNDGDTLPFPSRRSEAPAPPRVYNGNVKDKEKEYARDYPRNEEQKNDNYWNNRNNQKNLRDHPPPRPYNVPEPPSPYRQAAPLKTAKIGRQGGQRSPPLNVAPPYIPDPDYSPPGSPKVRGVLRPKSNYELY